MIIERDSTVEVMDLAKSERIVIDIGFDDIPSCALYLNDKQMCSAYRCILINCGEHCLPFYEATKKIAMQTPRRKDQDLYKQSFN